MSILRPFIICALLIGASACSSDMAGLDRPVDITVAYDFAQPTQRTRHNQSGPKRASSYVTLASLQTEGPSPLWDEVEALLNQSR